jgi:23S rRNA pseudouridine1911/1915/1917 synthase
MSSQFTQAALVSAAESGKRFDQVAALLFDEFSRSRLKTWILSGELLVNGERRQPRDKLLLGDQLLLAATLEAEQDWQPEAIDLAIEYEDESLLVLNKPAGLVVHPGAGNRDGTLLNALLHHCPALAELPRAGIVHRLDKDTSGLMVVAKQLSSHTSLVAQLQARTVKRQYQAVVTGAPISGGTVNAPMGRHPTQRVKMAVLTTGKGKEAITHYRILERFPAHTLVRLQLETGRTHQIRVHMAWLGYPLVGDPVYGGRFKLPKGASPELQQGLRDFGRQALHAAELGLVHPLSGDTMQWQVAIPDDMTTLLDLLRQSSDDDASR